MHITNTCKLGVNYWKKMQKYIKCIYIGINTWFISEKKNNIFIQINNEL